MPRTHLDVRITREPDWQNVGKKSIKVEKPCAGELVAMLECMKRSGQAADSACARERQALAACAATARKASMQQVKADFVRNMQRLARSWKRVGF